MAGISVDDDPGGVLDRLGDRRRAAVHGQLADALGAERAALPRALQEVDVDPRGVLDGRDDVGGEAVVEVAAVVELDLLHERPADRLERAALDLPGAEGGMDRLPDLADRGDADGADGERVGIDLDLDHVGAPGVGRIGGALVGRLVEGLPLRRLVAERDLDRSDAP